MFSVRSLIRLAALAERNDVCDPGSISARSGTFRPESYYTDQRGRQNRPFGECFISTSSCCLTEGTNAGST